MDKQIEKLKILIEALQPPAINYLQDGVPASIFESFLFDHYEQKEIPRAIISLYEWCNGTKINETDAADCFHLFPVFSLNSIESITDLLLKDMFYRFSENKQLPLFLSGHGEYICYNFFDKRIYYVSSWNPELELYTTIYDSAEAFFETITSCIEQKIYWINEQDGFWEKDLTKEIVVAKKINPSSDYWKRY